MIQVFQDKHRCRVCGFDQARGGWGPVSQPVQHTTEHLEDMARESAQPAAVIQLPAPEPIGLNTITQGNCLDLLPRVPSGSVDMVLCDLPYGTTACAWDSPLSMTALWEQYRRILTRRGAVVLTASQPFTTTVIGSNLDWFKYCWVWVKNRPTNFAHAKNKPMKKHEDVCVFSPGTTVHVTQSATRMMYNPQGLQSVVPKKVTKRASEKTDTFFADRPGHREFVRDTTRYPHSILEFSTEQMGLHPTQKPVALWEYLIRTYTNEGDTVLDNCGGSGTTAVACQNTGRNFIVFELDANYCEIARGRLKSQDALGVAA